MRIAHITPTFPPYFAGMGNVCYYQTRELAQLGHEVSVFTAAVPNRQATRFPGIKVHQLPAVFRLGNAPLTPGLLRMRNFDILHLHMPFIFGAELTWLNARLRGQPYVVTYQMDLCGLGLRRYLFALYQRLLVGTVLNDAALIMPSTLDYALASRLRPFLERFPEKIVPVPVGVDISLFRPTVDVSALRRRYSLEGDDRVILFVAALDRAHSFKGLSILLEALAAPPPSRTRALIVGEGELKSMYVHLTRRLGLSDRVTFCGRVPQEQLPAHYALADCLVLPSVTSDEAFGMVLLEAMACATPVIASNLPGVRSVVKDGVDGLLVQPGSTDDLRCKLDVLLADSALSREMGQRGRVKVEADYPWAKIGKQLERAYEQVLLKTRRIAARAGSGGYHGRI